MKTIDLTTEEAWHVSTRPPDWGWKRVLIQDRETTDFRDLMRSLRYQPVTFTCHGDSIVFAKVGEVLAPWDYRDKWHGGPKKEERWEIEIDSESWRRIRPDNSSYWQHRIADGIPDEFCLIERALAEEWQKWNEENAGINRGCGLLQDLMLGTLQHENPEGFNPWLSNRERKIVATVIQWLGTNVGRSFLHEASVRMGRPSWPFSKRESA